MPEPRLYQIHFQFNDRTEMVEQALIHSKREMDDWVNRVESEKPLPEGATWMICNEKSKHFVMTIGDEDAKS